MTTLQQVNFQKQASALLQKLQQFRKLQDVHMPGLSDALLSEGTVIPQLSPDIVDTYPIILPSDVSPPNRLRICSAYLVKVEDELQYADACDALEDLRHSLRMRTAYNQDKIANVTGQIHNTRARDMQQSVEDAVKHARDRYRKARNAVERLRGPGDWQKLLQVLCDSDIVGLNERALTREERAENERAREMGQPVEDFGKALAGAVTTGEGRRTLSWIWYSGGASTPASGAGGNDFGLQDGEFL